MSAIPVSWVKMTSANSYRVLESIKAGKRLLEARFSTLKIASKGQQSVYSMASKATKPTTPVAFDDEPPPSGQAS